MSAQGNTSAPFSYTWGIADNIRTESVVEFSPNVNYTVSDGSVSLAQLNNTKEWVLAVQHNHQVVAFVILAKTYCDSLINVITRRDIS